jgi:hypothetical protein
MLFLILWLIHWHRKRNAPKKVALGLLQAKHHDLTPSDAIELVRQASLCYFPRKEIAHLIGRDWYDFLDTQYGKPLFLPHASKWQKALYQKPETKDVQHLIDDCLIWVKEALPPKRRRRK